MVVGRLYPGIPTTIKRMDVNIINHHCYPLLNPKGFNHRNWGKTIILMVVEAQGILYKNTFPFDVMTTLLTSSSMFTPEVAMPQETACGFQFRCGH